MPTALAPGQLVDERYALDHELSADALGTTWEAFDRGLGRPVCLRELALPAGEPGDGRLRQALRTARTAIRVDHPGAVHVYDAFLDGDRLIVVSRLIHGRSLGALVDRKGRLPAKRVAALGVALLEPLAAAHAIGVVHGAINPRAVLVPDKATPLLAGFGLAPPFTAAGDLELVEALGTPSCVAPEQVAGSGSTRASDLWSLGATLYFAAEGTHAFAAATAQATFDAITADPPRPPTRATKLWPVLEPLLAREPGERPPLEEVQRKLADLAGIPRPADAAAAEPASRRRWRGRRPTAGETEAGPGGAGTAPDSEAGEAMAGGSEPEGAHDWDGVVGSSTAAHPPPGPGARAEASAVGEETKAKTEAETEAETEGARETAGGIGAEPGTEPRAADGDGYGAEAGTEPAAPSGSAPRTVPEIDGGAAPTGASAGERGATAVPEAAASPAGEPGGAEEPGYRVTTSWPPPRGRRSFFVVLLCLWVIVVMVGLLITNGYLGRRSVDEDRSAARPALTVNPDEVPGDWIVYHHPTRPFGVSYPPNWRLVEDGPLIRITDPGTGTELRMEARTPPGGEPEHVAAEAERNFSQRHPVDYRRLQMSPATYLGHPAALWEYTYAERGERLRAAELGFTAGKYLFTLRFQALDANWQDLIATFRGFLASVDASS